MLNSNFLKELEELVRSNWNVNETTVGDLFIKYAPLLKVRQSEKERKNNPISDLR